MKKRLLFITMALLAIGLIAVACGGAESSTTLLQEQEGITTPEGHGRENTGHEEVVTGSHDHEDKSTHIEGTRELTLITTEWSFTPETLNVALDEPVTLVLVNEGVVDHEVEIPEFGFHLHAEPGETVKGTLVPSKAGIFELACEIPGHRLAGMVGKLVVSTDEYEEGDEHGDHNEHLEHDEETAS